MPRIVAPPAKWTKPETQCHARAVLASRNYKDAEADLLDAIDNADRMEIHKKFDVDLILYCCNELDLTTSTAKCFRRVMRKCREVPELKEMIRKGETTTWKAIRLCSVLTHENKDEWLPVAKRSKEEIDRAVAIARPDLAQRASVHPVAENAVRISIVVSDECATKFERAKMVEMKRRMHEVRLEDVFEAALDAYLFKFDPIEKAKRAEARREKVVDTNEEPQASEVEKVVHTSRHIPAEAQQEVILRDQDRCQYEVNGKPCGSEAFTQVHHITLFSQGGTHDPENLVMLCSFHHRLLHERLET